MGLFGRKDKKEEYNFSHIKVQNEFIDQNDKRISEQEEYLRELEKSIERVKIEHPDVAENIALWRSNNELRFYLQQVQIELDTKEKQLDMIGQAKEEQLEASLKETKLKLLKLEQDIAAAKQQRESETFFKLSELYICAYTVANINDVAVGVFFPDDIQFAGNIRNILLKSIDGSRKISTNADFSKNEYYYSKQKNADLKQCISFAEACQSIGRIDLLTKKQVSVQEIYEVLYQMQGGFYFLGKTDITLNELLELMKQRSQEVPEIGGRQLTKLFVTQKENEN